MTVTKKCDCGRRNLQGRQRQCALCTKEKRAISTRARYVQKTYGLTLEDYDAMVKAAGGRCMCCKETRSRGYHWHVDHDHRIERMLGVRASVRGLICARCNSLLRKGGDSWSLFADLAKYLNRWPTHDVIGGVKGVTLDRRAP